MKSTIPLHSDLAQAVQSAIATVVGSGPGTLHEPRLAGNEWKYLKECLDSTYVSSVGKFVDRFEADLAAFTGAGAAVAVVNGTAALHLALKVAGVQSGDEVLVPALTFIATANAVAYCGANPHFVDVEERTLGVSPSALRDYLSDNTDLINNRCVNRSTGKVIRALVPMHTFGHPVDIEAIVSVARDFRLALVEDAAESIGSTVGGKHTGTFGMMGTLSFNGNKTITTGGGGAIITNDPEVARQLKHLSTTAKIPHAWEYFHDEVGYNYRLPNINAALGCAQLEQLPEFIRAKRHLCERYRAAFAKVSGVRIFTEVGGCSSNYWLQTLLLDESCAGSRDTILATTNAAGFMTRPAWSLIHRQAPYRDCPRMNLPVAESLERRLINLPSSAALGMRS